MNFILKALCIIILSSTLYSNGLQKVSLQLQWKHQFEFAGFYAAKYKGYYKDAGFDVEFVEHKDGIDQIQEVIDGKKTFGIWGTGLVAAALQGKDVVFLANYFKRSPLVLITQANLRLPIDLLNKRIMISKMDLKDAGLLNMFAEFNLGLKDIKRVTPSYDINDFIDKKVDAYLAFLTNEPYFLQKKGIAYNVLDPNNYGVEQYDINLFSSKKYVKDNPQKARAFIEASNRGWEYALKHKEEIVELILNEYNTQSKSKDALFFEANEIEKIMLPKIYPIGSIDPLKVRKMAEVFVQFSEEKYDIVVDKFILEDYFHKAVEFNEEERSFIRNNTIRCVTNTTWSPFNLLDKNNELSGIALDYWNLIVKKAGLKSQCKIIKKWTDVLNAIKNDKADITLSTTKTKERQKYAVFTKPYASFPIAIATRNDFGYISDFKAIKDINVAVGKNTSAYKLLLKNISGMKLTEVSGIDEGLELLSTGKVDAVAEILPVLAYKMNTYGYTNLKIAGTSNFNFDVMMMVNDDKKTLASIINKTIDTITLEEKQAIYNKWISVKYQQGFDYSLLIKISIAFLFIIVFILYRHKIVLKHQQELDKKNQELEESKRELNESNTRLTIAAQASFDLLYEWDVNRDSLIWYGDIDEFLGYDKGEVSKDKESWLQLIHSDDIPSLANIKEEHMDSTLPIEHQYRIRQKDGIYQYWRDYALPILDENNKPVKWIGVCSDLTLAKKSERQLIEQSKMVAMGEMIGNIAHQWRQPLSVISSAATGMLLQKELGVLDDGEFEKNCKVINENTQYLSRTIDDFRNFIKGDRQFVKFNLKSNIENFLNIVEPSCKINNIQLVLNLDESLELRGQPNELIQCYMNIFNNAKDALKSIQDHNRYFSIDTYKENETMVIRFKDNAGGIPKEILPRIFEPYFTTKHKSQGTGLGLSMVYNLIVDGMKGTIEVHNTPFKYDNKIDTGAEFIISLPLK